MLCRMDADYDRGLLQSVDFTATINKRIQMSWYETRWCSPKNITPLQEQRFQRGYTHETEGDRE